MADLCYKCYKCCCPCFAEKSRKSSKYGYVKYTASKQSTPSSSSSSSATKQGASAFGHKRLLAEVESKVVHPEQVFEFPQGRAEHHSFHPEMFVEKGPPAVTHQPKRHIEYGRFHSYSESPSSTMREYSQGVASGKYHSLPRRLSHDPDFSEGFKSHSLPRKMKGTSSSVSNMHGDGDYSEGSDLLAKSVCSSSLPDLALSHSERMGSSGSSTNSLLRRGRRTTVPMAENENWIPNLPILEEMALAEEGSADGGAPPLLQFSLHYDVQRYTLTVHLHHASSLPAMDRRGTSDPFVVLYMIPNKEEIFESRVIYQTLNPVFDQSFEFKKLMADDIRRQTLVLRVYDHDKFSKNDTIGGVLLPLEEADLFGVVMRMRIDQNPNLFSKVSKGDLLLALSYDPVLSSLKGLLLKATNLKKQDVIGLADPYVKIRIHYQKRIVDKWRSSIKRKTLIPVFNENFEFDVSGKNIEEISMEILVMDYDRFSKDDIVGRIHLGHGSEGEQEKRHWRDMIDSSPQVISQWHTIKSL